MSIHSIIIYLLYKEKLFLILSNLQTYLFIIYLTTNKWTNWLTYMELVVNSRSHTQQAQPITKLEILLQTSPECQQMQGRSIKKRVQPTSLSPPLPTPTPQMYCNRYTFMKYYRYHEIFVHCTGKLESCWYCFFLSKLMQLYGRCIVGVITCNDNFWISH